MGQSGGWGCSAQQIRLRAPRSEEQVLGGKFHAADKPAVDCLALSPTRREDASDTEPKCLHAACSRSAEQHAAEQHAAMHGLGWGRRAVKMGGGSGLSRDIGLSTYSRFPMI